MATCLWCKTTFFDWSYSAPAEPCDCGRCVRTWEEYREVADREGEPFADDDGDVADEVSA